MFGKKEGDTRALPELLRSRNFSYPRAELTQPQPRREHSLQEQYRDLVAQAYARTGVLLNDRFEVVHVQGEVGQFIRLPAGDLSVNIMDIVIAPLSIETRLILQKAQRERIVVRGRPVELENQHDFSRVTLIAIPSTLEFNGGEGILLQFEVFSAPVPAKLAKRPEADIDGHRINELEQELVATREQLQTSVEDLQSANENMQSVNEEYQSTAEELQSANEELQTSNEELQSSNEELRTLNDELTLAAEELKSTNRDLEIILNTVLSGIVVLDQDGRVIQYSEASKQVFNLMPTSIGSSSINSGSLFDLTLLSREIEQVTKSGVEMTRNLVLQGRNFSIKVIPLIEKSSIPAGTVITFSDETERKQAEEAMRRLATMIEDSNDAVIVVDLDEKIVSWNQGAEIMFGYSKTEALKLTLNDLSPETQRVQTRHVIQQLIDGQKLVSFEMKRQAKDGQKLDSWLTMTLLRNEAGQPNAIVVTERDLTALKLLSSEKEATRLANQEKSEFLERVSHELRTPLNAILGFSEIIKDELFGSIAQRKYVEYARDIHSSGTHLLALVNDILDLSKIERHDVTIEEITFDLPGLANETIHLLSLEADERGILLSADIAEDVANIKSDRRALQQILINLLNNAIKFTPREGRVSLEIRLDDTGRLAISVCDTGIGIRKEDITNVLKPFVQISNHDGDEQWGYGLGLAITQSLAELLGTKLEIVSEIGIGTTVTIRLDHVPVIKDIGNVQIKLLE